jgi:hypothetical protein
MTFSIKETVLGSAVADAGTFTVDYPSGKDEGAFYLAMGHKLTVDGNLYKYPSDFDVTLGTSNITITNKSGTTWKSGAKIRVQLEEQGKRAYRDDQTGNLLASAVQAPVFLVNLGAPDTADADSMIKAATSTELPNAETVTYTPDTDGTSPTDGVQGTTEIDGVTYWELDVPRNVSVNTTHSSSIVAMTVKVTGKDVYGNDMYEEISVAATGTNETDAGKKAFKYIRSIAFTAAGDAEANTCNVGFGDVLGLPVFLPSAGNILKELEDGAVASAGTVVAGIRTAGGATATDGDVRGTYDPNSAADGQKVFQLIVALPDPGFVGIDQYTP